mmetsp:Transcript_2263/g.4122  ORF Transcript_2263/g.4122 Transcript_2263/m.4122 type:complete len:303 (+) Transcript_2263:23-931(+)
MGKDRDRDKGKDRDRDRSRSRDRARDRDRDRDKGKKSGGAIDPEKDPEGYARYLKEREEKAKQEAKEKQAEKAKEARLAKLKVSGTQDFKDGAQVVVTGLQKNPQKNGSVGTLVKWVADKDRWAVEFANGDINNFKVENLQVMEETEQEDTRPKEVQEEEIPCAKVYITNLAAETTEQNLSGLFAGIGMLAKEPVRNAQGKKIGYEDEWPWAAKLYKPGTDGGDGCVEYVDRCSAKAAIKAFNGYFWKGKTLEVTYANTGEIKVDTRTEEERERSRERKEELAKLTKKIKADNNPLLKGIFG